MNFLRSSVALGLAIQLAASPGYAAVATQAIGTVVSTGAFRLNHATVRSNATLFEGAMVANGAAPVRMDLSSGARLELESESTVQVFGDRMVLQRGASRIDSAAGFRVEARGLTIQPDGNASTGRIVLIGARRVEVSAVTGSFRVLNPDGVLVAKIAAGRALALEPQSTADSARIMGAWRGATATIC
ncbi:MAG: hypothetical protein ABI833_00535 [Acidobacteriota bacterium]